MELSKYHPKYSIGDSVYVGNSCLIAVIDAIVLNKESVLYRLGYYGGFMEMAEGELHLTPTRKECHSEAVCRLVESIGKNCPLHCGHFLPRCIK